MTMIEEARQRLDGLPRAVTLTSISEQCGVSVAWLSRFNAGKIPNPGATKLEALLKCIRSFEG